MDFLAHGFLIIWKLLNFLLMLLNSGFKVIFDLPQIMANYQLVIWIDGPEAIKNLFEVEVHILGHLSHI